MIYLLQQYLDEQAIKQPHKIAAIFNEEIINYSDLNSLANQIANYLKHLDIKHGDRVCFCLHKSIKSLATIFGILKADAIYVPLDANSPYERLEKIVNDAKPKIVLYEDETEDKIKKMTAKDIELYSLDSDAVNAQITSQSNLNPNYQSIDSDLAYIFYTSGSTGTPKGVMITHRNVIDAAEWSVSELKITAADKLSAHPPFHFDLSTFDIYSSIKSGATLVLIPEKLSVFPGALVDYIEKTEITIWNSVPSLLSYLFQAGSIDPSRLKKVRSICFNGEVFPVKYLRDWMKIFPDKEFINMYGPTEATVQCSFYRIKEVPKEVDKSVPIGKSCANAEIFALDADGRKAERKSSGELFIRGACLSPGYWCNEKKTREVFIQNPFNSKYKDIVYKTGDLVYLDENGNYSFIGRKDDQFKRMGYRIEVGEIEKAIYSLDYVTETTIIFRELNNAVDLTAFIASKESLSSEQVSADLAKILPYYMIPSKFHFLSLLPKTSTGKIDRETLKKNYE
ncbi:MAG: amino acid adenylation domain-containing protein [bacterium]|nr:amino acid adenylation domain-containing protein [bacterium]